MTVSQTDYRPEYAVPAYTERTPVLEVQALSKSFGDQVIFQDLNFSINQGDVVAILGPSGVGKSTLLRCLNFLEKPDSGTVLLNGNPIKRDRRSIELFRKDIGMVFQQFNLFQNLSVWENCLLGQIQVLKLPRAEAEKRAEHYLNLVEMNEYRNAKEHQLSGGQKQRAAIARTLCMEPQMILFDEPTSALDPDMTEGVLQVIRQLAASGQTMMIVTHEYRFAEEVADRILFLNNKVIEQDLPAKEYFAARQASSQTN